MAVIKPFKGLRPPRAIVTQLISRPFDVLSSAEARKEVGDNKKSLYRITKPEVDFADGDDEYHPDVYEHSARNLNNFQERGWLKQDATENYYVYAQTMKGKTQYGLVVCNHVDDYLKDHIKKHELTRTDKEADRIKHIYTTEANTEPIFLTYRRNREIDQLVLKVIATPAEYDFITADGFGHHFWIINKEHDIKEITELFKTIPAMYIADGHHRAAAAVAVAQQKASENPNHTGKEEYNYFSAVCFPENQLTIMSYNRLIKDLNGLTTEEFLQRLEEFFVISEQDSDMIVKPTELHTISIYVDEKCYLLKAKEGIYNDSDPIDVLDVTLLSKYILDKALGITDLRSDKRIEFVGGIRGVGELKRRVDEGKMKLAVILYPVTMKQLMDIGDSGNIMPPKTTWFEPKLRSGLVLHKLTE